MNFLSDRKIFTGRATAENKADFELFLFLAALLCDTLNEYAPSRHYLHLRLTKGS